MRIFFQFISRVKKSKKANLRRYVKASSSHEGSRRLKIAAFIFPELIENANAAKIQASEL